MKKRTEGLLPITHAGMTRFNISLPEAVDMVYFAMTNAMGGEIFIPKIPSYRLTDVATAISPTAVQKIVGIRPGEKLHEEMITPADSFNTIELDDYYAILPTNLQFQSITMDDYIIHHKGIKVPIGFSYTSENNTDWLTVSDIQKLIKTHVDPSFEVQNLTASAA